MLDGGYATGVAMRAIANAAAQEKGNVSKVKTVVCTFAVRCQDEDVLVLVPFHRDYDGLF
jgi:hypothetical protein